MRDLIEHYKTLISANLFEGKMRDKRLFVASLKDPYNPEIIAASERSKAKVQRRELRLASKAAGQKLNKVMSEKRPDADGDWRKSKSFMSRAFAIPDGLDKKIVNRLRVFKNAIDTSFAKHKPENP